MIKPLLLLLTLLISAPFAVAEPQPEETDTATQAAELVSVEAALYQKLEAIESAVETADAEPQNPVTMPLTAAETDLFLRQHYRDQKELVDLASRLSAFGYVAFTVEQAYLSRQSLSSNDIPSFLVVDQTTNHDPT